MVFFSKKDRPKNNNYIIKKTDIHSILNFVYKSIIGLCSVFVLGLLLFLLYFLIEYSLPLIDKVGFSNILQSDWSYSPPQKFGFLRFIEGTLITSFYALIIAVPLSIGISLYISQYISDHRLKVTLKFVIELIAAIPSVIIGFWGIFTLGPALKDFHLIFDIPYITTVNIDFSLVQFLQSFHFYIGSIYIGIPFLNKPLAANANLTTTIFTATIALVIMIVPIIVSITVSIMDQVPDIQKEGAFALGATPWEMSRMTVLPLSTRGIVGAVSIGFGRALGETMAVTMLIGNIYTRPITSLFDTGSSITAIIANSYAENSIDPLARASFIELALILMIISLIVNLLARLLVSRSLSTGTGRMEA